MSYSTIEAAVATVIKTHADFSASNVSQADLRLLVKGLARFVILTFGAHSEEELTIQYTRHNWTVNVDVYVPWRSEAYELENRISVEAQKVIDTLQKYPRLNGTANVTKAQISSAARPELLSLRKGAYRGKRHLLEVQETVNPARVE